MLDYFRKTQFQICKIHQAIDFHREIVRLNGSIFKLLSQLFRRQHYDYWSSLHNQTAYLTHPESKWQNNTLQFASLSLCVSLSASVCVCVWIWESAHVHARDQLWVSFISYCPPCSLEQGPSLTCKLLLGLDWMASMSQESSHPGLPNTGIV